MTRYISLSLAAIISMVVLMGSLSALPPPPPTPSGETASGKFNSYFTNTYRSAGIFDSSPSYTNGCAAGQVVRGFTTQGMLLCISPTSPQYWSSTDVGVNIYFTGAGNVGIGTATSGAKLDILNTPIMTIGANIVSNGSFTSGTAGWTLGDCAGYNIDKVTVQSMECGDMTISTSINTEAGKLYRMMFTISDAPIDSVYYYFDNNSSRRALYRDGVNMAVFRANYSGVDTIYFQTAYTTWSIDNISIQEIVDIAPSLRVRDYNGSVVLSLGGDFLDNLGIGRGSLSANTTGYQNTANGANALSANTTGYQNTANGANALSANTTGYYNTANGANALSANTTGYYNTANGLSNLSANTTGYFNTANGVYALQSNITGNSNTANGVYALQSNTTGYQNTANGMGALQSNTTGFQNTANGLYTLSANTEGWGNTANGAYSLSANTTGYENTANGSYALYSNTTGGQNIANGRRALYSNTTGNANTANGVDSLYSNTIGGGNTANGYYSLYSNATGWNNTANGTYALYSNTTGNSNIANGSSALFANTSGYENIANGRTALRSNTTGNYNIANGTYALYSNTTGNQNMANGLYALYSNTTGGGNIANGTSSLFSNTTGIDNVAIGTGGGYNLTSGDNNIALGTNTNFQSSTGSNQLNIGNWIYGTSGNIGIGTGTALTAKLTVAGQVKITGGAPGVGKILTSDATGLASWQSAGSSGWGLTGNAGTTAATNFVGTTDNNDLVFKRNNIEGMRLSGASGNLVTTADALINGMTVGRGSGNIDSNTVNGAYALYSNTTGNSNTANGDRALMGNTTGWNNTAIGRYTLPQNTIGINNTAIGSSTLYYNTTGGYNTANGAAALNNNSIGGANTANGYASLQGNGLGSYNTAIGYYAGSNLISGDNNIAIGANTSFPSTNTSNQLNIGNWIYGQGGNIGIGTTTPGAKLEIAGTIKITGGTPGVGKILTSDATGLASWENPSDMPIGAVVAFNTATCPTGWVAANGSGTIDLRGEFIRGLDSGRGVDIGRILGSAQVDLFKSHTHNSAVYGPGGAAAYLATTYNSYFDAATQVTGATGGSETRPRNVALLYCTKISSSTSTVSNNTTWSNVTGTSTGNVTLATTGNVGVGTTNPTAKLEINSGIAGSGGLRFTNLTSTSATGATNGKMLTVNGSGDVILVDSPTLVSSNLVKLYNEAWSNAAGKINNTSGYSFTVTASGKYLFDFVSTSYASSAMKTTTFAVRQGTTVLASDSDTSFNNLVHVEYSGKMEVDLVAGTTYNVIITDSGVKNSGDWDRVYYKQVGGFSAGGGSSGIADLPVGSVMGFNLAACPTGWVLADGSGGTLDLRGEFIRGLDSGRGVDTGRVLGTSQLDALQGAGQKTRYAGVNGQALTSLNGGGSQYRITAAIDGANGEFMGTVNEYYDIGFGIPRVSTQTRPRNVALLYCMKLTSSASSPSSNLTWTNTNGSSTGNVILATTGNVGIGTIAPGTPLEINSTVDSILRLRQQGGGWNYMEFYNDTVRTAYLGMDTSNNLSMNGQLVVNTISGNVGIGTATPGAAVGMSGGLTINGTNATKITIEDNGVPAYALNTSSGGWTMFDRASGAWNASISSSGGNIGIGTVAPRNKLSIVGVSSTGDDTLPALGANGGKFAVLNGGGSGLYGLLQGVLGNGNAFLQAQRVDGTATSYSMLLNPNGGNVGIGTSNPTSKLEVNGQLKVDTNTSVFSFRSTVLSGNYGNWQRSDGAGSIGYIGGALGAAISGGTANDFVIRSPAGNILIYPDVGNVGIGTTTPGSKLDIQGQVRIGNGGATDRITLPNSAMSNMWNMDSSGGDFRFYREDYVASGTGPNGSVKLIINNAGNVGIGTTTPSAKLAVNGLGLIGGANQSAYDIGAGRIAAGGSIYSYGSMCVGNNSGDCSHATTGFVATTNTFRLGTKYFRDIGDGWIRMGNSTADYNGMGLAADNIFANTTSYAGAFIYNSDRRLKQNIVPLSDSLSKILSLNGYSFDWKKDGKHDIGVIAQEVEKVFPALVNINPITGMKGVEYGNLVAPIIEAIKELANNLKNNTTEIQSLKAENAVLKARLDAIEARLAK